MAEIFIYDDIGPDWWGLVSAKMVIAELDKIGKGNPVTVRINSPGGDVIEAQAIYNALQRHGNVTIEVDALAASAASYVAMAGSVIHMAENSMMMVHNAWTVAIGNADQIRGTAEVLDKFDGILRATYSSRTGQPVDKISELMAAETWLTATEAKELGFADEVSQPLAVAASLKPGRYAKAPASLIAASIPTKREQQHYANLERAKIQLTRRRTMG